MRIEWATICKEVQDTELGINLLGVNQDRVLVPGGPPAQVDTWGAGCFLAEYEELGSGLVQQFRVQIFDPAGRMIAWLEPERITPLDPGPLHPQGRPGRQIFASLLRFTVMEEGTYIIAFSLDDQVPIELQYDVQAVPSL